MENDLLLVFQKRRFLVDTNRKCQYESEVFRQKQVILKVTLENDLLLVFQKRRFLVDTNCKCQYDSEVFRQKQVILKVT
jgi:predicted nucleic-acid-binding Zn-ribbon protein